MARSGKLRHVDAALADEYSGDGLTAPRHRLQPVGGLPKRAQDLVGLVLDLLHSGGERVDLRQMQLQRERW